MRFAPLAATALLFTALGGCTELQVASHLFKRSSSGCAAEGMNKVGEPYMVDGVRYTPAGSSAGYKEKGIASWYGDDFHGKATANGECYNMYAYTAAHKTLPLPTVVRVTNLENNKSVVLKVNDRGPFVRGRLIDLSYAAAQSLDIVRMGSAPVMVEAIGGPFNGSNAASASAQMAATGGGQAETLAASGPTAAVAEDLPADVPAPGTAGVAAIVNPLDNIKSGVPPTPATVASANAGVPAPAKPQTLPPIPASGPKPATLPLEHSRVFVQVGAFGESARAADVKAALEKIDATAHLQQITNAAGASLTRVRSGPYNNVAEAEAALARVTGSFPGAKIVVENK
ncbi:MAG TPA: septal ring lytic transglycosylase RlpA family protein [Alphaproteobacteria bacterium]|nr:septal ring lytic transglycosylase RlpA family protein [Alphaproteobacteria bacterium]